MKPKNITLFICAIVWLLVGSVAFAQRAVEVESSGTALGRIKNVPNFKTANDIPAATSGTLTNPIVSGTLTGGAVSSDISPSTLNQERWLMATFISGEDLLRFNVSSDGTNWNKVGGVHFTPASGGVRDPQIVPFNSTWFLAYTNGAYGLSTTFSIISSTDLSNWASVANPSVASVPGAVSTWSPVWLNDSGTMRIMVGVGPNSGASGGVGMVPYALTATTSDLTGWSAPVAMTNSGTWPGEFIPVAWVKTGSTSYQMFGSVYTSGTVTLQCYTSTVYGGPYTAAAAYAYTGTNFEGVSWVQTGTSTANWRGFTDKYNLGGIHTFTTSDTFATITNPVLISSAEMTSSNCGVYRATSAREIAQIDKMVATAKQNRPNPIGVYEPGVSFYNGSIGAAFDAGFRNTAIFANTYQGGGTGSVTYSRYDTSKTGLLFQMEYDLARYAWYATSTSSNSLRLAMTLTGTNNGSAVLFVDGSGTYNGAVRSASVVIGTTSGTINGFFTGTFTLISGTIFVSNTNVTTKSNVIPTLRILGGTRAGNPDIVVTSGSGFSATGGASDTSTYNYVIINTP